MIVNTHFLPAEMIAALRTAGRESSTPQLTVTTDFETHRLWVNQPCDHYFTATEEGAVNLAQWGVPAADVTVTGIPIHPVFSRAAATRRVPGQTRAGGRPARDPATGRRIRRRAGRETCSTRCWPWRRRWNWSWWPAATRNSRAGSGAARRRRRGIACTCSASPPQMDELMTAADLVVSKPGGLTTSEALACGAAMVVVNPIPGQESRNSDFLLENGAAIKVNNVATLPYKLTRLLRSPERMAQLKRNARELGKPDAAFRIARAALDWPNPPAESSRLDPDHVLDGRRPGVV